MPLHPTGLIAATLLGFATGATAAPAPADAADNGALHYWRAWSVTNIQQDPVQSIDFSTIGEPGFTLTPEQHAELARVHDAIAMLEEAAAQPWCDFGIQYEKGPGALLPHLTLARRSARILLVDGRLQLDGGDTDAFSDRVAASLGIAEDLAGEKTVISALVSAAIFRTAESLVDYALSTDTLDRADRLQITAALDQFNADDPFFIRGSVRAEGAVMGDWLRDEVFAPEVLAELLAAEADPTLTLSPRAAEVQEMIQAMFDADDQVLLRELTADLDPRREVRLYRSFMTQCAAAFDSRDGLKTLEEIEAQLIAGDFGIVARVMAPSLTRLHTQYWDYLDRYHALREKVAG